MDRSDRPAAAARARATVVGDSDATRTPAKMSLCNTFRLPVISFIIVFSCTDTPVAGFTLGRTTRIDLNRDLAQEESVILEVKRKEPNDIPLTSKDTNNATESEKDIMVTISIVEPLQNIVTENYSNDSNVRTTDIISTESLSVKETVDNKGTDSSLPVTISTDLQTLTTNYGLGTDTESVLTTSNLEYNTGFETTTEFTLLKVSNLGKSDGQNSSINKIKQKFTEPEKNTVEDKKLKNLDWKKYTTIDRKKTLSDKIHKVDKEEDIVNAETNQQRITLKDTLTSYIPSLEQLKNDLLASTFKIQTSDSLNRLTTKAFASNHTLSTPFAQNIPQSAVETKRAGFLNFSEKTTTKEVKTDRETSDFKVDNHEPLRLMFETESPEISGLSGQDILNSKSDRETETQSVLNDDAIKEELLKEESINDNKNAQRQREDYQIRSDINKADLTSIRNINSDNSTQSLDDNLSVKPIGVEKSKNFSLYIVSPNYKPMKKIEVLPPKLFVRDPDDNSWRNESLSSLGIVFKPKNSSKPLTQVLKNKTETEWNNMPDRDSKNDLPDLRERLQKMAEKRKSRRKKIDSLGNIIYFDYEENSNSAEHSNTPFYNVFPSVSTLTPDSQSPSQIDRSSTDDGKNNTTSTLASTTESIRKKLFTTNTTKKPKKFFNLPEYYESTDDEDSDYLNMAKIDLKKFTTSLRPSTPFHPSTIVARQPDWLKVNKKHSNNLFPERKATVQYFPPLTTQKVNINDYDNGFKSRVESFITRTESPKHALPVASYSSTTTVSSIDRSMGIDFELTSKSDLMKDLILTQAPTTTESGPTGLNNDGYYDRGTYIMKHFKDFVNVAAKDSEFDKNTDYIPYTEAPLEGITKTDFISYEKEKTGVNIDDAYDYESQFRRDVLQRFVDNFNQNSERYKSGFPVLFNSSVIHRGTEYGRDAASSRAFMRGSYNSDIFKGKMSPHRKACDSNCEKITVELSPAYELHYYVPEQEENEEALPEPVTLPYHYRL